MTHRRSTFATALLAGPLALALVACGGDTDNDDDLGAGTTQTPVAPETPVETPVDSATPAPAQSSDDAAGGDLLAAAQTAIASVEGSTLFTIDADDAGWEVTVVSADGTENDVSVSLDGASVTRGPVVDRDDDGDDSADDSDDLAERQRLLGDARIDYAAAIETARGAVPEGTVTGADLDLERGTATWDVQLDEDTASERTVTVDAVTGEVLRTERDD